MWPTFGEPNDSQVVDEMHSIGRTRFRTRSRPDFPLDSASH